MSIYFIIYIVVAILAIIISNNLVYIGYQRNKSIHFNNDHYIAVTIYSLLWPAFILVLIIIFGVNFIWKYILFPLLTFPGRLYIKYRKE